MSTAAKRAPQGAIGVIEQFVNRGRAAQAAADQVIAGQTLAGAAMEAQLEQKEFQAVPIGELFESPFNPRQTFADAYIEELAASIKKHGVLSPLLVRSVPQGYEVVFGACRLRAARRAGLAEIPVRVRAMSDAYALELMLVENLQRQDIHELEEARGYRQLIKRSGYTVQQIAETVGKSIGYVYARLKLADLTEGVQNDFARGSITAGHAILLARLSPQDQARALKVTLQHRKWSRDDFSVRELKDWIAREVHLKLSSAPWPQNDPTLLPEAGPCTSCPKRTGNFEPHQRDQFKLGPDICTDRACYQAKTQAFFASRLQELAESTGKPVVQISNQGKYDEKPEVANAVRRGEWAKATKPCKHVTTALMVDGPEAGETLRVCTNKKCETHFGMDGPRSSYRAPVDRQAQAQARAARLKQRIEQESEKRTIEAILAKVPEQPGPAELELIARAYFSHAWHELKKRICARRGWEVPKHRGGYGRDFNAALDRELPKLPPGGGLLKFIAEIALHQSDQDQLRATAERYKVNPKKISADVAALLKSRSKVQTAAKSAGAAAGR